METADIVKWIATVIQLIGYGLTGLNLVPYNVFFFFIGIGLWFAVGYLWKDRAIMVVHVGDRYIHPPSHIKRSLNFYLSYNLTF